MSRPPRHSSILTPRGLEGCILFLKRLQDIDGNYFEKYDLEPSVFWHPVLILQTNEATSEATICNLTTLNDCDAEDRFSSSDCRFYLALWPKHPPMSGQPQLRLQGDATLRRPGYINIRQEYLIHQSMLQPYDWNEPTDYYRLTQKSFTVVIAKLDTIYYSTRLAKLSAEDLAIKVATSKVNESVAKVAKLDAEIRMLMTVKEILPGSKQREGSIAVRLASIDNDITRLMIGRDSMPRRQQRSDQQLKQAGPQAPFTATNIEAIQVKPGTPFTTDKIRMLVFVGLLAAAMIGARSRADPAWGKWLVRRSFETLMQVLEVALAISWELGKLIAAGLGMLAKTFAVLCVWFGRRLLRALVEVSRAAWTNRRARTLIEAGYRVIEKAAKELVDGVLPAGFRA